MRKMLLCLALGCLGIMTFSVPVSALIRDVPDLYPTIQDAIYAANNGDEVRVAPGVYTENLVFLARSIKVYGRGGADSTILQPEDTTRNLVDIPYATVGVIELYGFTLRGSRAKHVIHVRGGSSPKIHRNILRDNISYVANAAEIGCEGTNPIIERNLFIHNRSLGGVAVFSGGAIIVNNTFDDNSRGFWSHGSSVIALNNIVSNSVQFGIGDIGFAVQDYNCVYNNNPNYAIGAVAGPGSIQANPQYTDPAADDFIIQAGSPCVDAGDPSFVDPDGSRVDMGAYPALCLNEPDSGDCDLDGVLNIDDNCPAVANADQADTDADMIGDVCDNCPSLPNTAQENADFDMQGDLCDNCPDVANADQLDADTDGIGDVCDNCIVMFNPDQANADADALGDACDACPLDPLNDSDGDGFCANLDNCPIIANANQADGDGDGIGDVCDDCVNPTPIDSDGDGVDDACDNCRFTVNPLQEDSDNDTMGDLCDPCPADSLNDLDSDGVCGNVDNCPFIYNPAQEDGDSDGIGDACGNMVFIESKTVEAGTSDVAVGVYVSNEMPIQSMILTLEVRSVTPGAFIRNKFNVSYKGIHRAAKSAITAVDVSEALPDVPMHWSDIVEIIAMAGEQGVAAQNRPTPEAPNSCSGPVSSSFHTIGPLDFISPDGVLQIFGGSAAAGFDRKPTYVIDFDVTDIYGSFVIDTCCATPANHTGFVDANVKFVTPNFIGSVITIACPCACAADPNCDGVRSDVVDVVNTVNVAFRGVPAITDQSCAWERTDANCSGATDVVDVVKTVSVAFRGASAATEFCDPCAQ